MNHLLNSAVMPHAGCYELISISDETFAAGVLEALANEGLTHYIGYKSTLTMVEQLVGVSLGELNLSQTTFEDGDIFYVIRLKYRVSSAEKKEDNPDIEDFEFFKGVYSSL